MGLLFPGLTWNSSLRDLLALQSPEELRVQEQRPQGFLGILRNSSETHPDELNQAFS